jgi:hypothetical protein
LARPTAGGLLPHFPIEHVDHQLLFPGLRRTLPGSRLCMLRHDEITLARKLRQEQERHNFVTQAPFTLLYGMKTFVEM